MLGVMDEVSESPGLKDRLRRDADGTSGTDDAAGDADLHQPGHDAERGPHHGPHAALRELRRHRALDVYGISWHSRSMRIIAML